MNKLLHLFPKLDQLLIEVLSGLKPEQWQRKTVCPHWCVKDIAALLLDGCYKSLSAGRDKFSASFVTPNTDKSLREFINDQNWIWVKATKRLSPELMISLLKQAQAEVLEHFATLDPEAPPRYSVSWNGEESSKNSFDVSHEYAGRWLHQQQIRQAVGAQTLINETFYPPFLEVCMMALPYHYAELPGEPGQSVNIKIVGDLGGDWQIKQINGSWRVSNETDASSQVYIDQNIAWLLFSGGIDSTEAAQYWQVVGNQSLGRHVLSMRTFII